MCSDPHRNGDGDNSSSSYNCTTSRPTATTEGEGLGASASATAAAPETLGAAAADEGAAPPSTADRSRSPPTASGAFRLHLRDALSDASSRREREATDANEAVLEGHRRAAESRRILVEGHDMVRRGSRAQLMAEFEHDRIARTHGTETGWILECGGGTGGGSCGTLGGSAAAESSSSAAAAAPRIVRPELRRSEIRRLACGGGPTTTAAALSMGGDCFAWRRDGEAGTSPPQNADDYGILQVAPGKDMALFLSGKRNLYACNLDGPSAMVPVPVFHGDEEDEIVGIASGASSDNLLAWSEKGVLVMFTPKLRGIEPGVDFTTAGLAPWPIGGGRNYYMQKLSPIPGRFPPGTRVASAAVGGRNVLVAFLDALDGGRVYSAGSNEYGQLGHGLASSSDDHPLTVIQALKDASICQVAAGKSHALALTLDKSKVYAWGRSDCGQIGCGRGCYQYVSIPVQVRLDGLSPSCRRVVDVAAGGEHSVAKTHTGDVYVWGSNEFGQLGHPPGTSKCIYSPQKLTMKVVGSDEPVKVIQMVGGVDKTIFLVSPLQGPQLQHYTICISNEGTASGLRAAASTGFLFGSAPVPASSSGSSAPAPPPLTGLFGGGSTVVPAPAVSGSPSTLAAPSLGLGVSSCGGWTFACTHNMGNDTARVFGAPGGAPMSHRPGGGPSPFSAASISPLSAPCSGNAAGVLFASRGFTGQGLGGTFAVPSLSTFGDSPPSTGLFTGGTMPSEILGRTTSTASKPPPVTPVASTLFGFAPGPPRGSSVTPSPPAPHPVANGGIFGSASPPTGPTSSLFGSDIGISSQSGTGTRHPPFAPNAQQDGSSTVHLHSIVAMPPYESYAFEELRVQDYANGNRGESTVYT